MSREGGLLTEAEGVADVIRDLPYIVALISVSQNAYVVFFFEANDFVLHFSSVHGGFLRGDVCGRGVGGGLWFVVACGRGGAGVERWVLACGRVLPRGRGGGAWV